MSELKKKIILHVDDIAAGGVTSPGSQSSDEQPASKPKDTPEKLAEQPSNQLQISRLLDRLKEETKADPVTGGADIALGGSGRDGFRIGGVETGSVLDGGAGNEDWLWSTTLFADLRGATVKSIERLDFYGNKDGQVRVVWANADQFGSGGMSKSLAVEGNGIDTGRLVIFMQDLTTFTAANFQMDGSGRYKVSIVGDADAETITGTDGVDFLSGREGNDVLKGGDGSDQLNGGEGGDIMRGGAGDDLYTVDSTQDRVQEVVGGIDQGGYDWVESAINYKLRDAVEGLTLIGSAINGTGNGLDNSIYGNAEANVLKGAGGADYIVGGMGQDTMFGGGGADVFRFEHVDESGQGVDSRNTIGDFQHGVDLIDVSFIAADVSKDFDTAFVLDTDGVFTAGEFRIRVLGNDTYVSFFNDADTAADMQIVLTGVTNVTVHDFIL